MYDDIETFMYSSSAIDTDTAFLCKYISNYIFRSSNREKIDQYYTKFPEILDRVLGTSTKTFKANKYQHNKNSLVDRLSSDQTTFKDFLTLMSNFMPIEGNEKNIFSSICNPADYIPSILLSALIISKNIEKLLYQKKSDYILYTFSVFQELSKSAEVQKENLEKNRLILNVFEYFIFFFLLSIKELNYSKFKVNLREVNRNFQNLSKFESSSSDQRARYILQEMDMTKSLIYNFFYINFKLYLEFFSKSTSWSDYDRFKFIISALEFIWLSDYILVPNSSETFTNPLENYLNIFNNPKSYSTGSIPNILLIDCLFLVIKTLQSRNLLYTESNKTLRFQDEPVLFKIQKPLFYFFKTCFIKFSSESMNSESSLLDIAKLWYKYITPWSEGSLANVQKRGNEGRFTNNSYIDSKPFISDSLFVAYIFNNILFYTELFNDYILAFSKLNALKNSEIIQLRDILQLFKIQEAYIIGGLVQFNHLEEIANGKVYNNNVIIEVENHVKFIGSSKLNIFPFLKPENQKAVKQILNTIQSWIQKIDNKGNMNDETTNFMNLLLDIKKREEFNEFQSLSNSTPVINNRIVLEKLSFKNPWSHKITRDESTCLFYMFRFIAYQIDSKIRGIPIRYDRRGNKEPPITNLRFLCNYYSLIALLITIGILYLIIWLLAKMIRSSPSE